NELFNCVVPADQAGRASAGRMELTEPVHLGLLLRRLDDVAGSGKPIHIHLWGDAVGIAESGDERAAGRRAAELYTLCFAPPAVAGIVWHGLADGDAESRGDRLLRRDLAP